MGVAYINRLKKAMDAAGADKGIVVANARYTFAARRNSKKYAIELIPRRFPSFNIFKHSLVPKHEIVPPEKAKEVLEKYHVQGHNMPWIRSSDIAAIAIGASPGDILKIIRESSTAGKYFSYRYVIDG